MSTPTTPGAAAASTAVAAAAPPPMAPARGVASAPSPPPPRRPAQQLPSGSARPPTSDGRSPPPPPPLPPHWRFPGGGPFFDPYSGFARNGYGGGGGGGYFSQLNRGAMPHPPPPPPPPHPYALGHRLPPPGPFAPRHFGLPAPPPMFGHRHRFPPFGANFAARFSPLNPFGAPFNPEANGSCNNFHINNLETLPLVNSAPVRRHVIVTDGKVEIIDHPELLRRLRYQVEYYFSDENFFDDWYLKSVMDGEGWVAMKEIASFRRVRELTKNLDVSQLFWEALSTSLSVEIQEDKIRKCCYPRPLERGNTCSWSINVKKL